MSKLLTNLLYKKDGRNIFSKCGALSNQSNVTNNNSSNINGKQKFER